VVPVVWHRAEHQHSWTAGSKMRVARYRAFRAKHSPAQESALQCRVVAAQHQCAGRACGALDVRAARVSVCEWDYALTIVVSGRTQTMPTSAPSHAVRQCTRSRTHALTNPLHIARTDCMSRSISVSRFSAFLPPCAPSSSASPGVPRAPPGVHPTPWQSSVRLTRPI
jgi:hypothetical protein